MGWLLEVSLYYLHILHPLHLLCSTVKLYRQLATKFDLQSVSRCSVLDLTRTSPREFMFFRPIVKFCRNLKFDIDASLSGSRMPLPRKTTRSTYHFELEGHEKSSWTCSKCFRGLPTSQRRAQHRRNPSARPQVERRSILSCLAMRIGLDQDRTTRMA